jgi:PAS domain S-box-containing protein
LSTRVAQKKTNRPAPVTEQELLDAFLEHIPDHVYFKDRESRFVRISRSLTTHFGLSNPADAVNKTDFDMFSAEHAEQAFADEQEIIRTGKPVIAKEEKETWADGREAWASSTKIPLRDLAGNIIGTMGISRDITERVRAEQELEKYREHLEELVEARTAQLTQANRSLAASNTELERFASVASHDLQEPLRMVAGYTQLLGRRYQGKLDAEADEFISFAVDGANRMQQLIQDLLSYSRLTTNGKALEISQSQAACEVALMNLRHAIEESGAIITVDPLPAVQADAAQLSRVFQNLIGNAIKYRGEDKPRIQVAARTEGPQWVFSVHDNGIGIEPQFADRLFELFQRLPSGEKHSGSGMGLAICRRIVERHGGRIWVQSVPGEGATFLFTMPRAEMT